jgi:hypothetical protein
MAKQMVRRPPAPTPRATVSDWLALVDHDGAFLTPGVLLDTFPAGFDRMPTERRAELRSRVADLTDDPVERSAFQDWMLRDLLAWGDELVEGQQIPQVATAAVAEHGVMLRPDLALVDSDDSNRVRLGVFTWPNGTDLEARAPKGLVGDEWRSSPRERAERWARESGVPLALVTEGERWLLVWSPRGAALAAGSFRVAELADERVLQDGMLSLLGASRFFSVSDDAKDGETLERLFERSADTEVEVTKGLGRQVRRSVELLVSALSREHVGSGGRLLASVADTEVYEAAVTVMMRLVFLLFAEERRLLPAEDPLWADSYSVLDLRGELRASSLRDGEDALEKRATAWARLLATFRAVHGGVNHDRLTLPAYGGALFDPARFPFLEGRHKSGSGVPPVIDDRTILAILDALLTVQVRQGRGWVSQQVSYKALDVEQIGHCYEGLLDHGCAPVDVLSVGLIGPESDEPELTVDALDGHRAQGFDVLCAWLSDKERCGKSTSALTKALAQEPTGVDLARLRAACDNDGAAVERILPYWGLIRSDLRGLPVVFRPGGKYVTQTSTRRNMGAQYTTKALAEEVVQYALEPLTYDPGPQNEADANKWKPRTPAQILDLRVCDPAVGSGAILTAAGRYLADRLLDAIDEHGPGDGPLGERLADLLTSSTEDRVTIARREIVDHCLYGVDKNPVAAEMAKLSLWLTTMSRDRPFTFLDHAIQSGDSLLGITSIDQLRWLHLDPASRRGEGGFATLAIETRITAASELAQELQSISVVTGRDAEHKRQLHERLKAMLDDLGVVADVVVGASLSANAKGSRISYEARIAEVADRIRVALDLSYTGDERAAALEALRETAELWLRADLPDAASPPWERRCLHWPLVFPELCSDGNAIKFNAIVGNPPFQGGTLISGANGVAYRDHIADVVAQEVTDRADLVAFFFRRASELGMVLGLLATNTLSQGDTQRVGLRRLIGDGWTIYRARKSEKWPNDASLDIAKTWLTREIWSGEFNLNGTVVELISPALDPVSSSKGEPARLAATVGQYSEGVKPLGQGFLLSATEAQRLITADPSLAQVIRPYVNGKDVNDNPRHVTERWIIDFKDWDEAKAETFEVPYSIALEFVKPERQRRKADGSFQLRKPLPERWWQFAEKRMALSRSLAKVEQAMVLVRHAPYPIPARVPADQVFSEALVVFPDDTYGRLGLLSSALHQVWAIRYSSTLGGEANIRYTASDVYATFPQPRPQSGALWGHVEQVGKALDVFRSPLMIRTNLGITKTYNRVHSADEQDRDIVRLRALHVELDYAVRDAYGWTDLDLDHHHWETPQGMRFTVSPDAKDALLDRLLELNHERYAEEVAAGLHDSKKPKAKKAAGDQGALDL